jgi:hypothetical protein
MVTEPLPVYSLRHTFELLGRQVEPQVEGSVSHCGAGTARVSGRPEGYYTSPGRLIRPQIASSAKHRRRRRVPVRPGK